MKIDDNSAKQILDEAAAAADTATIDKTWAAKIEKLSELCETGAKTHVAAFGTALLAKATDINVDVFALKVENNGPRAYSARQLAKNVLAKGALLHKFDIGVSSPEPLNNQPYFREARISREMPVRPKVRPVLDHLCTMLTQLDQIGDSEKVRAILRTFIALRRKRAKAYVPLGEVTTLSPLALARAAEALVRDNSEGGKRAQAVAAAAFDIVFGADRVEAGRINDPSRKIPGDILVLGAEEGAFPLKSIEVRDKPVELTDLIRFRDRASKAGVKDLGFIAVGADQGPIDSADLAERLQEGDANLRIYWQWSSLVEESLAWADGGVDAAGQRFVGAVRDRLIALEASEAGVGLWAKLLAYN